MGISSTLTDRDPLDEEGHGLGDDEVARGEVGAAPDALLPWLASYAGAYVVRAHIRSSWKAGDRRACQPTPPAGVWRASVFVADEETTVRRYAHCEDGAHGFYFHVMKTKLAKAGALEVMRDFRDQPDSELSTKRCLERLKADKAI
jgi:hypothetical protein